MKVSVAVILLFVAAAASAVEALVPVKLAGASADGVTTVEAGTGGATVEIAAIERPPISTSVFALRGLVRYADVAGQAYLQLDSDFGERGSFFSKTLADRGPLAALTGTSDWREFVLPFYAGDGGERLIPKALTVTVVLPGTGRVELRDVKLYQYGPGEDPMAAAGQWFDARTGTLFGAVGGTAVGLWGALIGVLAARSRAKGFVLMSATVLFVVGILALIAGLTALLLRQPYAVYYPLLLVGGILAFVTFALRRSLPQRYEATELDRMRAMDS